MPYTDVWDESFPPDTQPAKLLGQDIRDFKTEIRERTGTYISGSIAARPTPEFVWAGLLYFSTDEGKIYRWSGTAWVDVTSIFIPTASSFTFTVAGAIFLADDAIRNQPASFFFWRAPFDCTVNKFWGYQDQGVASAVNVFRVGIGNLLASDLALSPGGWIDGGALQNNTLPAGATLLFIAASYDSAVAGIGIQLDITKD